MRVSVVGTGYVGLVSGACLASKGHQVICVDIDASKIEQIERGETPIYEKGLETLLRNNVGERLRATTDLAAAVRDSELTLIAVGTPFDGQVIDLHFLIKLILFIDEFQRIGHARTALGAHPDTDTHGWLAAPVKQRPHLLDGSRRHGNGGRRCADLVHV